MLAQNLIDSYPNRIEIVDPQSDNVGLFLYRSGD